MQYVKCSEASEAFRVLWILIFKHKRALKPKYCILSIGELTIYLLTRLTLTSNTSLFFSIQLFTLISKSIFPSRNKSNITAAVAVFVRAPHFCLPWTSPVDVFCQRRQKHWHSLRFLFTKEFLSNLGDRNNSAVLLPIDHACSDAIIEQMPSIPCEVSLGFISAIFIVCCDSAFDSQLSGRVIGCQTRLPSFVGNNKLALITSDYKCH